MSASDLFKQLHFFPEPEFREELLEHGRVASFKKEM